MMMLGSDRPSAALPQRVPSLDDIAGEWIPDYDVANPPAVHNFHDILNPVPPVGLTLSPLYALHHQRYTVYWKTMVQAKNSDVGAKPDYCVATAPKNVDDKTEADGVLAWGLGPFVHCAENPLIEPRSDTTFLCPFSKPTWSGKRRTLSAPSHRLLGHVHGRFSAIQRQMSALQRSRRPFWRHADLRQTGV